MFLAVSPADFFPSYAARMLLSEVAGYLPTAGLTRRFASTPELGRHAHQDIIAQNVMVQQGGNGM